MTDGSDSLAAGSEETAAAPGEGECERADVIAAISACAAGQRSGCLLVWNDDVSDAGELFFVDGWLIAATFGREQGRDALAGMLRALPVVTARFFVGAAPERRTLDIAPRSVRPRLTALSATLSGSVERTRRPPGLPAPAPAMVPADQAADQAAFVPSKEWQAVSSGTAVPPGGEYRLELGGSVYARWPDGAPSSSPPLPAVPKRASRVGDAVRRLVPAPQAALAVLVGLMVATATVATVGAVLRPPLEGEEERLLKQVALVPVPTRAGATWVPTSATATPRGVARVLPVATFAPPAATIAVPTPWWSYDRPTNDWTALTAAPAPATLPDRWLTSSTDANLWLAPVTRPAPAPSRPERDTRPPEVLSPATLTTEPAHSRADPVPLEVVDLAPEDAGTTDEAALDQASALTPPAPVVMGALETAQPERPPPSVGVAPTDEPPVQAPPAPITQEPETVQPTPVRSDVVSGATPTAVAIAEPAGQPSPTVAPQATEEPPPTATVAATATPAASATATPAATPTAAATATPQSNATRGPNPTTTPQAARTTTPQPAAPTPAKGPASTSGNGNGNGNGKPNEGGKPGEGENPAKGGGTAPGKADDAKDGKKDTPKSDPKSDPKGEPVKPPDPGNGVKAKDDGGKSGGAGNGGDAKKQEGDPGKSAPANDNKGDKGNEGGGAKDAKR